MHFQIKKRLLKLRGGYFNLEQVEYIYEMIQPNRRGITRFLKDARDVAIKRNGIYQFKNEEALWNIFQEYLGDILAKKNIDNWGRLMDYIS